MIVTKRHSASVLRTVRAPFRAVGRFLLRMIGVPIYRTFFMIKRHSSGAILPAKRRLLYLISNRYTLHVAVLVIVAVVGIVNLGSSEVRAETFGKDSMLYALVSGEDFDAVEVVAAEGSLVNMPSSYMDDAAIDPRSHLDLNYSGEGYVTTAVGTALAIASVTPIETTNIIPTRNDIEDYVVEEGDVLGSISDKFGLSLSTLLWANDLTFRSVIRPGDQLVIPPADGVLHTVKEGETLSDIVGKYNADSETVIAFNKLASADDLRVGEQLVVPGGEPSAPEPVTRTLAPVTALFQTQPSKTVPSSSYTSSGQTAQNDFSGDKKRGSATGQGNWVWPTDWRVITQYYGWRHTGLDIDGDYSTNSYAAAAGTVIYAGWRGGYGLTVEVDHGNGFVTRYAHHSKIYVSVGEEVVAGQALAQTGTTGRSTGTHLHFEVIKNGKFQNPLEYIR